MSDHNARAFDAATARAFLRSAGTVGSAAAGAISSVKCCPRLRPQLTVHFKPVTFLAVWFELGLKRDAIDGAFDRRHATRGELRTGGLWQNEKRPGINLLALGRPQEFRSETDRGFGHFAWYH